MDLAIDRKTLVRVVLEGLGRPANQLMPTNFFGGSKSLPERPYDVAKAKQLLADAGYPKGFEIDFHCTNNRLPGDSAVCEALSQMWARAGLKVNANALNGTVFFPAQQKGEFSLWMSGWGTLTGEASYTYGSLAAHGGSDDRSRCVQQAGLLEPGSGQASRGRQPHHG